MQHLLFRICLQNVIRKNYLCGYYWKTTHLQMAFPEAMLVWTALGLWKYAPRASADRLGSVWWLSRKCLLSKHNLAPFLDMATYNHCSLCLGLSTASIELVSETTTFHPPNHPSIYPITNSSTNSSPYPSILLLLWVRHLTMCWWSWRDCESYSAALRMLTVYYERGVNINLLSKKIKL